MRRISADIFLKESKNALVLDVRSPAEYAHAHLPGAVSLPLFSNEERKVVGTTYKQISREAAIKIGLDYFGPRMKEMVETVEQLIAQRKPFTEDTTNNQQSTANLFLYCWRGGMRSGAVAWLLDLYGFKITVLAGGYKAYRQLVLQSFEQPYNFKMLGGYTGSGKTEVLQQMQAHGERVIDLEKIASHKGSAFGSINMPPQPSQEMFENLLSNELVNAQWSMVNNADTQAFPTYRSPFTIWLEDESQRIGNINIPMAIWHKMRQSPISFLSIPFEERLQHITEEYSRCDKIIIEEAIGRIKKRLGPLDTKMALEHLAENNLKAVFEILLRYYDKHYLKGLNNRENLSTLLQTIEAPTVSVKNALLVTQPSLIH